ncbi:hypothetical protein PENTCL1PPCAC_13403, partial [Pristionchus entomophagus]
AALSRCASPRRKSITRRIRNTRRKSVTRERKNPLSRVVTAPREVQPAAVTVARSSRWILPWPRRLTRCPSAIWSRSAGGDSSSPRSSCCEKRRPHDAHEPHHSPHTTHTMSTRERIEQ